MFSFVARHPITKFLRSPSSHTRRALHTSPPRRGSIFRNAEGQWSTSIEKIGTFTLSQILAILGGLFTGEYTTKLTSCTFRLVITLVYVLCKAKDAEKKCQEFEARAHNFLVRGINERRRAVKILIAAKECLRQKEAKAEEEDEPFDEKEARLKAETLEVLERQVKFLNDLDAGEPVEVAPGHRLRKH